MSTVQHQQTIPTTFLSGVMTLAAVLALAPVWALASDPAGNRVVTLNGSSQGIRRP